MPFIPQNNVKKLRVRRKNEPGSLPAIKSESVLGSVNSDEEREDATVSNHSTRSPVVKHTPEPEGYPTEKLDREETISGYTGHVPGSRWIFGRQASRERARMADYVDAVSPWKGQWDQHQRESSEGGAATRHVHSMAEQRIRSGRHVRPPSAHMRRFHSVDSMRDAAVQSDASESVINALIRDDEAPRYKNASSNIPDAPPTPTPVEKHEVETDSGISNDHHRGTSSNSRSSSYTRYLTNHSTRPLLFSSGPPATGYTGYVPGWKQVIGRSFSSSLRQMREKELSRIEKMQQLRNGSTRPDSRAARPMSRVGSSGIRYRSSSERRQY